MIKAAIFDMDGLLIDSEPFWKQAEKIAFKTVGVELSEKDFNEQMGTRIDEVVAYRYRLQPWKGRSQKDIEAMVVDGVIQSIKREGRSRSGVIQTLDICKKQNLRLALASSSPTEIIDAVLDSLKIRHYFDHVHSAEHETHGKPHPAVFVSTADLLQVPHHDILVFEDAPNGVLAAKAARMTCIAVPHPENKNHPFVRAADAILDSLEEFDEKLLARF